jgi:hypothetical protein
MSALAPIIREEPQFDVWSGRGAVDPELRNAATLPVAEVYRDRSNVFDACDLRGKMFF